MADLPSLPSTERIASFIFSFPLGYGFAKILSDRLFQIIGKKILLKNKV